jgi:hypothetical protein
VVDLFDVFCPRSQCTLVGSNGRLLYRDAYSHPSVEAMELVAPELARQLSAPE